MAIIRHQRSAATASWIDPATGLPEVDTVRPNNATTTRAFLTGDAGYRFCNFMEVWADYDSIQRRIVRHGFAPASKMYRGPSFAGIESHAFAVSQGAVGQDPVTFTQIVGARTESPEVIGGLVGGIAAGPIGRWVGEQAARAITGFPPIWSEIEIKIFGNGSFELKLLRYSYFPSLTLYKVRTGPAGNQSNDYDRVDVTPGTPYYDAIPKLDHWKENGWGALRGTSPGPTDGNPWSFDK
jgi:hypothetical protein